MDPSRPDVRPRLQCRLRLAALAVVAAGGCSPLDWFGSNLSINIIVPGLVTAQELINYITSPEVLSFIGALVGSGVTP